MQYQERGLQQLTIPADISKILIPRFDTLGDIVLLEGFLERLIQRFPHAQITMLVREGYDQLAPLFPAKLNWITTTVHPYRGFDESDFTNLETLLGRLSSELWDLVFFTTYNRSWIDEILASKLPYAFRIAIGELKEPSQWVNELLIRLKLASDVPYDHVVWVDETDHEVEKYQQLWTDIFPEGGTLPSPRLSVPSESMDQAGAVLERLPIAGNKYFVCAPAGTQNVTIKKWPADRFAEVISWVHQQFDFHPVLVGHENERKEIAAVATILEEMGIASSSWLGATGELAVLAGLLQNSEFYVGNDTGTMHIAAAIGIPVVGIFGGGTFPRFLPTGSHCIGIAGELPCFGCDWDCIFEDAPCVRLVSIDDVQRAIRFIVHQQKADRNLRAKYSISRESAEYIQKAQKRMKKIRNELKLCEADRAARLNSIHIYQKHLQEAQRELKLSEADRAARLEVIHDLQKNYENADSSNSCNQKKIYELNCQLKTIQDTLAAKDSLIQSLRHDLNNMNACYNEKAKEAQSCRASIDAIKATYSWKVTEPVRRIIHFFRRICSL